MTVQYVIESQVVLRTFNQTKTQNLPHLFMPLQMSIWLPCVSLSHKLLNTTTFAEQFYTKTFTQFQVKSWFSLLLLNVYGFAYNLMQWCEVMYVERWHKFGSIEREATIRNILFQIACFYIQLFQLSIYKFMYRHLNFPI